MVTNTLQGFPTDGIPRPRTSVDGLVGKIEGVLTDFLRPQIAMLDGIDPELGRFGRISRDLILGGGKRIRPTFAYWGWRGLVGPDEPVEPVLPALAALEVMHTFALVHDDVMDASATRRGAPTAHRIFAAEHREAGGVGNPQRFGEAAAILIGDMCLVWADQLLGRTAIDTATLFAVRACYDRMRLEAVAGQYLDVLGESQPGRWSVDRALLVARHKTASYTVQRPLQFGKTLALHELCRDSDGRAAADVDAAYDRYGIAVGEAFQLRDDLLGVYGDPRVTGKPAGDDLRTGKPTTLLMLAHRLATDAQRAEWAIYSPGAVNPADGSGGPGVARMADLIIATGAPDQMEKMIQQRVDEGIEAVMRAPIHPDTRVALTELAVAATFRPA